jgi:hypothetical protein
MSKIISKKRTSAIFLAIVLVAGILTLSFPSFIVGAQAESEDDELYNDNKKSYGKDNDESSDEEKDNDESSDESKDNEKDNDDNSYKSKDSSSSVFVKKIKCNNVNVNLNGIDVDIGLPTDNGPLNGPIAEAQAADDEEWESNSFGSGSGSNGDGDGQSDSDTNNRVVCISKNNNVNVGEEPPEPRTCEECFEDILSSDEIEDFLDRFLFESVGDVCDALDRIPPSEEGLELFLLSIGVSQDDIDSLIECLKNEANIDFREDP